MSEDKVGQRGYVMVPAWLLIKQPTGNDVLIYCTLASHGSWNPGIGVYENCKPSIELMVEETGLSRSTIKRCLANLIKFKAIKRTLQYTAEGDPAPSLYRVIFGTVVEPKEDDEDEGVDAGQVGSQEDRPPRKRRSKRGRSTGEPTGSVHPRTDGRSTDEPTVGPPVDRNQEPSDQEPEPRTTGSEDAAHLRRDEVARESDSHPGPDGQITITGEVEEPANLPAKRSPTEVAANSEIMGLARGWLDHRAAWDCPVIANKGGDPLMALRGLISAAKGAGYSDDEIKYGLCYVDRSVPTAREMEAALIQVRRGWRPRPGWRPGDARASAPTQRPSTTDQRVGAAVDLANKYALEEAS